MSLLPEIPEAPQTPPSCAEFFLLLHHREHIDLWFYYLVLQMHEAEWVTKMSKMYIYLYMPSVVVLHAQ